MDIHPNSEQAYRLLHNGILALSRAEQAGLRVDMDYLTQKKTHLDRKIKRMEEQFRDTKMFRHWEHSTRNKVNIYSHTQLAYFLYDVKKLKPPSTTESGQGSTDEEALKVLNIPELEMLLDIRKYKKIQEVLLGLEREQVDGVIHPFFNLHNVRTFRSSSDSPNFQNIPKRDKEMMTIIRKALKPRPGNQLMEVDYSGIEVRIAACYHKDKTMLSYINDPTSDMHGDMAKQIFCINRFDKHLPAHKTLRQAAKNGFVFPQFYGDYYKNCAVSMACRWGGLPEGKWSAGQGILMDDGNLSDHLIRAGFRSLDQFTEHIKRIEADFWGTRFVGYARWKEKWWSRYQEQGYIDLLTGFRCSGIMTRNDVTNYPIQGSAFHCLLWSFTELDRIMRTERWNTCLVGQIHDAMLLDVNPAEMERVTKVVQRVTCDDLTKAWPWIIVPLEVDTEICPVDGSWADKI